MTTQLNLVEVAEGKKAFQSSTEIDRWDSCYNGFEFKADLTTDGNTNPLMSSCTCSHTKDNEPDPWWLVDLLGIYKIHHVKVFNREGNG